MTYDELNKEWKDRINKEAPQEPPACDHKWERKLVPFIPRYGWSFIDWKCECCGEFRDDSHSKSVLNQHMQPWTVSESHHDPNHININLVDPPSGA
jgi:hypothetical protein